jgi:hypothetical protein
VRLLRTCVASVGLMRAVSEQKRTRHTLVNLQHTKRRVTDRGGGRSCAGCWNNVRPPNRGRGAAVGLNCCADPAGESVIMAHSGRR